MKYQLTDPAARDIRNVLFATREMFGPNQVRRYGQIIERGIGMIAAAPQRPGSIPREDIAEGVRLFHLGLAARRRGAAAHCLYYRIGTLSDGTEGVIVLRLLHERMEALHRIVATLNMDEGETPDGGDEPTSGV